MEMRLLASIKYSLDNKKRNPWNILLVYSFSITKMYIFLLAELLVLN